MADSGGLMRHFLPDENPNALPFPQEQLYPLLQRQLILYTGIGSSSVPVETAGEILKGILYSLRLGRKGSTPEECFALGQAEIQRQIRLGRSLLKSVQASILPIKNLAYQDTIAALPRFFTQYDPRYLAHDIPCDIDYPLCVPIPDESGGIVYINTYLRTLAAENQFCRCFPLAEVHRVIEGYALDWKNQLYNIYDAVFTNAIGCVLADLSPGHLLLSPSALMHMYDRLTQDTALPLKQQLQNACEMLHTSFLPGESYGSKLLGKAAEQLRPRLQQALKANRLPALFVQDTPHSEIYL